MLAGSDSSRLGPVMSGFRISARLVGFRRPDRRPGFPVVRCLLIALACSLGLRDAAPADAQDPRRPPLPIAADSLRIRIATPIQQRQITWDFETGDLRGWRKTGNAFDFQPTLGDNPSARDRGQPSNHQGRYWIGTFERYRGLQGQDPGDWQGDEPTGTLTSVPFEVRGGALSFLVGGGGGFGTRVELRILDPIEGEIRAQFVSGADSETMRRVRWDLAPHVGRRAVIRIVDDASGSWGHINVDDFRFGPEEERPDEQDVPRVEVPDVRGMRVQQAKQVLAQRRLEVGEVSELPVGGEPGEILRQRPEPGRVVQVPGSVDLWVAAGQAAVRLRGLDPSEAEPGVEIRARVLGAGFTPLSVIDIGDGVDVDTTIFRSPEELLVRIRVAPEAGPGPRDVRHRRSFEPTMVMLPPSDTVTLPDGFRVLTPPPPQRHVDLVLVEHGSGPLPEGDVAIEVRVANVGDTAAGDVPVSAASETAGLRWTQSRRLTELLPGGEAVARFTIPASALVDVESAAVRISVDPDDVIAETDEGNNSGVVSIGPLAPRRQDGGDRLPVWALALAAVAGAAALLGILSVLPDRVLPDVLRRLLGRAEPGEAPGAEPGEFTRTFPGEAPPEPGEAPEPVDEEAAAPPPAAPPPGREPEPVRFTVFHPKEVRPDEWHSLLAYVHVPSVAELVVEDSRARLAREPAEYGERKGEATRRIARGTEITVVPELPGFAFNPERREFRWLEDWHCADFRMRADSASGRLEVGTAVNGRVAIYVGPVLIGEVRVWTFVAEPLEPVPTAAPVDEPAAPEVRSADPFRAIFPSYSHRDAEIVAELKKAYRAIGDDFLQDVDVLRSGEKWNATLLEKIDQADVFQLYWSESARASEYVEQEWRHAVGREVPNFIRPLFWEEPMPAPPPELSGLHFAFIELRRG